MNHTLKISISLIMTPVVVLGIMAIYIVINRQTCEINVTQDVARRLLETDLSQPKNNAVLRGLPPVIEEIQSYPFNNPGRPGEQGYKFRLSGSRVDEWWFAWFDHCGYFELSSPHKNN